jgi:hypothetical protein
MKDFLSTSPYILMVKEGKKINHVVMILYIAMIKSDLVLSQLLGSSQPNVEGTMSSH